MEDSTRDNATLRRIGIQAVRVCLPDGRLGWQSVTDNHVYVQTDADGLTDLGRFPELPMAR